MNPPFKTTEFTLLYNIIYHTTYRDQFLYIDDIMEILLNYNNDYSCKSWWIDTENYVIKNNLLETIQSLLFLFQITSQEIKL